MRMADDGQTLRMRSKSRQSSIIDYHLTLVKGKGQCERRLLPPSANEPGCREFRPRRGLDLGNFSNSKRRQHQRNTPLLILSVLPFVSFLIWTRTYGSLWRNKVRGTSCCDLLITVPCFQVYRRFYTGLVSTFNLQGIS